MIWAAVYAFGVAGYLAYSEWSYSAQYEPEVFGEAPFLFPSADFLEVVDGMPAQWERRYYKLNEKRVIEVTLVKK